MFNPGIMFYHGFLVAIPTTDPILWNMFLFFLLLGSIIAAIVMYLTSQTPEDWTFQSAIDKPPLPGRLTQVSQSIHAHIVSRYTSESVRKTMQLALLEKVRVAHGLTSNDVMFFQEKDPQHLQHLINDTILYKWLFLGQPLSAADLGMEEKKIKKQQHRIMEMETIMKKMEAWNP